MALALKSKYDGTIRFYREPKKMGGDLLAVFPREFDDRVSGERLAFTAHDGYAMLDPGYVRNLRPAREDWGDDRREAERMLEQINQRSEYARELDPDYGQED